MNLNSSEIIRVRFAVMWVECTRCWLSLIAVLSGSDEQTIVIFIQKFNSVLSIYSFIVSFSSFFASNVLPTYIIIAAYKHTHTAHAFIHYHSSQHKCVRLCTVKHTVVIVVVVVNLTKMRSTTIWQTRDLNTYEMYCALPFNTFLCLLFVGVDMNWL